MYEKHMLLGEQITHSYVVQAIRKFGKAVWSAMATTRSIR